MNIGETIKKLRREKDMTQEQPAEYLNITTQAVIQVGDQSIAPRHHADTHAGKYLQHLGGCSFGY